MKAVALAAFFALTLSGLAKDEWVKSPGGKYACHIVSGADGSGMLVYFLGGNAARPQLLLESPRWVEVAWSGQERWFAITDHADGHSTAVHLFGVNAPVAANAKMDPEAELAYRTPQPQRYNSHWTLQEWNLVRGTVRLRCRFQDGDLADTGKWHSREYMVPFTAAP